MGVGQTSETIMDVLDGGDDTPEFQEPFQLDAGPTLLVSGNRTQVFGLAIPNLQQKFALETPCKETCAIACLSLPSADDPKSLVAVGEIVGDSYSDGHSRSKVRVYEGTRASQVCRKSHWGDIKSIVAIPPAYSMHSKPMFASGAAVGACLIWDALRGKTLRNAKLGLSQSVNVLRHFEKMCPHDLFIGATCTGEKDRFIRYNFEKNRKVGHYIGHDTILGVGDITANWTRRLLYSCAQYEDPACIRVWDVDSCECQHTMSFGHGPGSVSMVLCSDSDENMLLVKGTLHSELSAYDCRNLDGGKIFSLEGYTPDTRMVELENGLFAGVSSIWENNAAVVDTKKQRIRKLVTVDTRECHDCCFLVPPGYQRQQSFESMIEDDNPRAVFSAEGQRESGRRLRERMAQLMADHPQKDPTQETAVLNPKAASAPPPPPSSSDAPSANAELNEALTFLVSNGLEEYVPIFAEAEAKTIADLTLYTKPVAASELERLIPKFLPRQKFLNAVQMAIVGEEEGPQYY